MKTFIRILLTIVLLASFSITIYGLEVFNENTLFDTHMIDETVSSLDTMILNTNTTNEDNKETIKEEVADQETLTVDNTQISEATSYNDANNYVSNEVYVDNSETKTTSNESSLQDKINRCIEEGMQRGPGYTTDVIYNCPTSSNKVYLVPSQYKYIYNPDTNAVETYYKYCWYYDVSNEFNYVYFKKIGFIAYVICDYTGTEDVSSALVEGTTDQYYYSLLLEALGRTPEEGVDEISNYTAYLPGYGISGELSSLNVDDFSGNTFDEKMQNAASNCKWELINSYNIDTWQFTVYGNNLS